MTAEQDASFYEGKPHGPIEQPVKAVAITLDGKPFEFRDASLRLDEHLDLQLTWTGSLGGGFRRIDQDLKVTFEGGTTAEFLIMRHRYHVVGREDFVATSRFSPLELTGKSRACAGAVILNGPSIHPKAVEIELQADNLAAIVRPFDHFHAIIGAGVRR
ncbi:hypothetical protein EB230_30705 [Mesorhizobium sp. NZP2234]|uniref:hypothetical protein n=1 Tax=Mesorhizobium sp. NZP2234 TaxID=2483402 RepID=UPI001553B94B|nr:hypothetical protein [Mesorhizobium sp. NZP2234]QKC92276.1 hypothetical protein EB230_30705 [Mesorhizobium sp. NZP2234]